MSPIAYGPLGEDAALVERLNSPMNDVELNHDAHKAALRIEALAAEVERLRVEVGEGKLLTESAEYKIGQEKARAEAAEAAVLKLREAVEHWTDGPLSIKALADTAALAEQIRAREAK